MTKEKRALIEYRMERAREALDEAKMMLEASRINAHVNRLYYACFYAVSAILLTRNLSTSKHGYLRSLLHREFAKTGLIPQNLVHTLTCYSTIVTKATTTILFDSKPKMSPTGCNQLKNLLIISADCYRR